MEIKKSCIRCGLLKTLGDFYKHKQMGDGHLNKCKSCCKEQSAIREKSLRENPDWVESEKIRAREKYHRLGYKDIHKPTYEEKKAAMDKYLAKFPERRKAKNATSQMKTSSKDHEFHHWSYLDIHLRDCIELLAIEHAKLHRYLMYDVEYLMYRRIDTMELLDTKESHLQYYESLADKP